MIYLIEIKHTTPPVLHEFEGENELIQFVFDRNPHIDPSQNRSLREWVNILRNDNHSLLTFTENDSFENICEDIGSHKNKEVRELVQSVIHE